MFLDRAVRNWNGTCTIAGEMLGKKVVSQVLIADDQPVKLAGFTRLLQQWGYDTVSVRDGVCAWEVLERQDAPTLALLDRDMPGYTGEDLCRMARARHPAKPLYIIMLTAALVTREEKVISLSSGADDFISSPFYPAELRVRLQIAERIMSLQTELRDRVRELEVTLAEVRQLRGLLPICMDCRQIRDEVNAWHPLERYITRRAEVSFTHSICPTCLDVRRKQIAALRPIESPNPVSV